MASSETPSDHDRSSHERLKLKIKSLFWFVGEKMENVIQSMKNKNKFRFSGADYLERILNDSTIRTNSALLITISSDIRDDGRLQKASKLGKTRDFWKHGHVELHHSSLLKFSSCSVRLSLSCRYFSLPFPLFRLHSAEFHRTKGVSFYLKSK